MTSVTTVLSNFMYRRSAERVETEEPEDIEETIDLGAADNNSIVEEDGERGEFIGTSTGAANRSVSAGNISTVSSQQTLTIEAANASRNNNNDVEINGDVANEDVSETSLTTETEPSVPTTARTTSTSRRRNVRGVTLRDLEEERELLQRRTGGCVLLSGFVLLRLWIQALMSGDFGLLLLCLVFTSWTARFVRYTREREEDLNRMINEWDDTSNEGTSINDARLSRMSFQSQLALAIMQSQIQMLEGGYGHPDGGENKPGVNDEAKARWDRFEYKSISSITDRVDCASDAEPNSDGSGNDVRKDIGDDTPTCSICLCEYEKGDKLISLPCKHVFHEDCITSWTNHNTRCPLCNADLNTEPVCEVV